MSIKIHTSKQIKPLNRSVCCDSYRKIRSRINFSYDEFTSGNNIDVPSLRNRLVQRKRIKFNDTKVFSRGGTASKYLGIRNCINICPQQGVGTSDRFEIFCFKLGLTIHLDRASLRLNTNATVSRDTSAQKIEVTVIQSCFEDQRSTCVGSADRCVITHIDRTAAIRGSILRDPRPGGKLD